MRIPRNLLSAHPRLFQQLASAGPGGTILTEDCSPSDLQFPPLVYINNSIGQSNEFLMYTYKIKRCERARSHDWTECPYAHRGEKATRRDPRKVPYAAVTCPDFRNGKCHKGDACELAHGVFEFWLHPARYRTRACNAGPFCRRKVCFFAHSPEQLRFGKNCVRYSFVYEPRMNGQDESSRVDGSGEVSNLFKNLQVSRGDDEESDPVVPNIDWISELVK